MTKYYRIIKEHPMWEVGAIIANTYSSGGGYVPVEDIWDKIEDKDRHYYESKEIVEAKVNKDFFERVYKSEGEKLVFKTASQMKKLYASFVGDTKKE